MTISLPRSLFLGLSLALAACGGEGLVLPPDGAPAHIQVMSGNGQGARVGSPLPDSLVVKVTDTQDRPVAGANVVFEFTADGSTASPPSVGTDANGLAASRLVLGTRVGPVAGTVRVPVEPGVTPVEAAITATAFPEDANGIALVSGNPQTGPVGTQLPAPLVVAVTDAFGNPIPNITVEWSVTGGGSVSAPTTLTGENGQASVTRTLGPTAGQQTTLATAALAGSPVTFTHTATAGTATGVVKVSGDGQSGLTGTELAQPLVVQVFDAQSNPIANRAVTWLPGAGDGTVNPQTSNTDAQGLASTRWTLGSAGNNTVNAVVSGLEPATFTATATAGGPSASRSRVEVQPTSIPAGGSSSITVRVRDASGNRLAGVSVSATSSGSGNEISPASATTGEDGVATFSFRSTVAGEKTITVVAGGVTLDDHRVITVLPLGSTTEITGVTPEPSTSGDPITVTFSVIGEGSGTPTGTVTIFSLQETGGCEVPVSQGSCSFVLDEATTHQLRASYSGDLQFEGSSDPDGANHVVLPATTNQPPTAAFVPPSCFAGTECQFSGTGTDSDGTVDGYAWDFGDPTSATPTAVGQSVTHNFATAGDYVVTLTVTDNDGAASVPHTETVTVQ